ncbi:uncharacterized protein [Chelonus insularis]|uniref:uncharacterized protein n=1 Tax=Chelonus insularis TaxID=460826 RepID=UPI0015889479|nr:uncharacterized protein LOC118072726 [Chelonus insularis]
MGESHRNGREKEFYSLYVTNLPAELDENGIKNVFNKFGTVTGILVANDLKFAFVSYDTYAEAEAAIANLDHKPPLDLYVEFRKNKIHENRSVPTTEKDFEPVKIIESQDHRYNYSRFLRPLEARPENFKLPPPEMSPYYYNYPKGRFVHPSMSEFYDNIPYPETNALWSRGKVIVDPAGQRHVALGRGYVHYHIPDPFPEVERQLNRVYEKRMPNSYVHGNDELSDQIGQCLACLKNAIYSCKSCGGSYCSPECQAADWPKHRTQCMIPSLIQTSNPNTSNKNVVNTKISTVSSQDFDDTSSKLSDKQKLIGSSDSSIKSDTSEKKKKIDLASRLEISRKSVSQVHDRDFEFRRNENSFLSSVDFISVQIVVVHKYGLLSVQKTSDIEKLMDLMAKLTTMSEKFEKVKNPVVGKIYAAIYDGIWHRIILLDFSSTLQIDYIDYGTIEEVTGPIELRDIGELANIPRFSRIIRIRPQYQEKYKNLKETDTIEVRMIDVDNDGIINVDILDKIQNHETIPTPLERPKKLIHIEAKPKPLKLSQAEILSKSVEQIDLENNKTIESLQKKIVSPVKPPVEQSVKSPVKESFKSPMKQNENITDFPNILATLKKGVNQVVGEITERINKESVIAAILYDEVQDEYTQLMEPLKNDCDNLKSQYTNFKPQVNDLVCGFKSDDGFWRRGRVLSTSPTITIASIDEGLKCDVDAVIPVPPKYSKIHPFTIILTSKVDLSNMNTVIFKVFEDKSCTSSSDSFLRGELIENPTITFEIRSWNLLASPIVAIKNGSKVSIQSYRSPSILCIRSLEDNEVERYHRVIQDTAKACQIALDLTTIPEVGDMVMAQFLDENYYRAIVLEIEKKPENPKIKVNYVDFGNNEVTTLKKLKVLPAKLKKEPYCAKKVTLKGIKNVPPSEKAIFYLESIADQETPYILHFSDSIDNGVTLKNLQGTVVNDTINEFLEPNWQKKEETNDEDYLKLENMEVGKLGKVGEVVKAYFLAPIEPGFKYVFASIDTELIAHISQVLPELLTEYCNKSEFYIPRNNELCIAKYENEWYRGCCIKPSLTPDSAEIYFLDYGNIAEVKHQDLRMMKDDFLKPSALGLICNTLDFVKTKNSKELLEKLDSLLIPNEIYSLHILKYEDTEWTVEFPEIKEKLIKDGLLDS